MWPTFSRTTATTRMRSRKTTEKGARRDANDRSLTATTSSTSATHSPVTRCRRGRLSTLTCRAGVAHLGRRGFLRLARSFGRKVRCSTRRSLARLPICNLRPLPRCNDRFRLSRRALRSINSATDRSPHEDWVLAADEQAGPSPAGPTLGRRGDRAVRGSRDDESSLPRSTAEHASRR